MVAVGALLAAVLPFAVACGTEVHTRPAAGGPSPGATGSGVPEPGSFPPPTSTPNIVQTECSPDGVQLEVGRPNAATGLRALEVKLINCGDEPYRLDGYPALRVLDEEREPFDVRVVEGTTHSDDAGPEPITVRPGEYASFGIEWRNTVTLSTEPPVNGTSLEVTPADGRDPLTIRPPGPLDLGTTGRLETTAWSLP